MMKSSKNIAIAAISTALAMMLLGGCGAADAGPAQIETTTQAQIAPSSSATSASEPPATSFPPQVEVLEIELADLAAEYQADPAAAVARYKGLKLLVRNVYIEDMSEVHKPPAAEQFITNLGFRFRTDYLELMMPLNVGYTVDVEGTFVGPQMGYVLLNHCTFTITDSSFGYTRPDYQYTFS